MSETTEQWAWRQPIQGNLKIVLYWIAHREVDGICHDGSTLIAQYAGIPQRTVERGVSQLISMGLISRVSRGVMAVQTVTSDGSARQSDAEAPTVTSDGSDRQERRFSRVRGKQQEQQQSQGTLEPIPEWVTVIHESEWTTTELTLRQITQIETKYVDKVDLYEQAMAWEDYYNRGKGKNKRPKDLHRSFGAGWVSRRMNDTNGTTTGHDAIPRNSTFKPAGATHSAFDGIE